MIGWFPPPYPDELFYSICARYAAMTKYSKWLGANVDLFGGEYLVNADLPCNLQRFTMLLPPNQYYTADRIIDQHSLLNFYAPFLAPERVARIRTEMELSDAKLIHTLLGKGHSSPIQSPRWLRYCPCCVLSDRQQYGEAYWHRLHQVVGVEVCLSHEVFLEDSSQPAKHRSTLFCAEHSVQPEQPRKLCNDSHCHRTYLKIARDAAWLLSEKSLSLGLEALRVCCTAVLREKGFTTRNGRIMVKELTEALRNAYPAKLFHSLQSTIHELRERGTWIRGFVDNLLNHRSNHPLRFLLITQCLGLSAESFFERCEKDVTECAATHKILSKGGCYPCLNPICPHFGRLVIANVEISYPSRLRGRPLGTFTCGCGYSYARKDLSDRSGDVFQRDFTKTYGEVWEAALRRMWCDDSLRVSDICRVLRVHHGVVKYHAIRLGLAFPRLGPMGTVTQVDQAIAGKVLRSKRLQVTRPKLIKVNREKWLAATKKHPDASRMQLQRQIIPKVHYWLRQHDREWLKANMPPVRIGDHYGYTVSLAYVRGCSNHFLRDSRIRTRPIISES